MPPEVIDEVARVWRSSWANPGSRHSAGRAARSVLESSRERLASLLNADPAEIVYTSGATEANNLAIAGLASSTTGVVALLPGEHPSIEEPAAALTTRGWTRVALPIDPDGQIDDTRLDDLDWPTVRLVAVVLAHSETGVIRRLDALAERCRAHRIPLHIDAVQAVGKMPLSFAELPAASLSVAAHKFGGPRGVGALVVRKGVRLTPQLLGGLQENQRRAGTESPALTHGMATALDLRLRDLTNDVTEMTWLRDAFEQRLLDGCRPAHVHAREVQRLPNTSNIAFPGCDSDSLLAALDLAGVCCSIGSACASGSTEPSPILVAMGCPPEILNSSVRFSLGPSTTESELNEAAERIRQVVAKLRS
jgi:cysteine desulfurase